MKRILLLMCLVSQLFAIESAKAVTDSGWDGNIAWFLDTDTGILTLSGDGSMNDYNFVSIDDDVLSTAPWGKYHDVIRELDIQPGITSIGDYAFFDCSNVTSVAVPGSVTRIGSWAFYGCSGMTSMSLPNCVTDMGERTFYFCESLTDITIPESVTNLGNNLFGYCSSLVNVTIPNSVTSIGIATFLCCSSLSNITIPGSVTSIERCAFQECSSLTNVIMEGGTPCEAGSNLFAACPSLQTICVPNGTATTYKSANGWSHYAAYIANSTIITGKDESIVWRLDSGAGLLTLSGNGGMEDYSGNRQNPYPIGGAAQFVTTAPWGEYCNIIKYVSVLPDVTSIGNCAFDGCTKLTSITIPNSVTSIGGSAFQNCKNLTGITLPNSVTSIGHSAFDGCSTLTNVTLPESLTHIELSLFKNCSSLTNVTIPEGVTSIKSSAFEGCSSLTDITLPSSVTYIDRHAFYDCTSLANFYCYAEVPPTCDDYGLAGFPRTNLFVPRGCADAYCTTYPWVLFFNIYENDLLSICPAKTENAIDDTTLYDLSGKRIDCPTRGFYIQGGKKYMR